jgi:hypothetical protein
MNDEAFDSPYLTPRPQLRRTSDELLCVFIRLRDRAPMSCLLRFNGTTAGWEVRFFVRGEFGTGRRAFVTRASAVRWAEEKRQAMERGAA